MFRSYENPYTLEDLLEAKKQARAAYALEHPDDLDVLVDYDLDIQELEDRINFAWQDDEYDCEHADPSFEDEEFSAWLYKRFPISTAKDWDYGEPSWDYDKLF